MTDESFSFQLPDDAPPEAQAVALLGQAVAELRAGLADLAGQQQDLREAVATARAADKRKAPASIPWPLRWADLDREAAWTAWGWLIAWVGWAVDRYQLAEEIPHCWPQHPPLVEELTALAAGWYAAYDEAAPADSPIVWHERFARARPRLREFDDHTRCRNGTHTPRRIDLPWPDDWTELALDAARADLSGRPTPTHPADDRARATRRRRWAAGKGGEPS